MINDNVSHTGQVTIVLRDENGNIIIDKSVPNMVVTSGKSYIAARMAGAASNVMSHMAVGVSNLAVVPAQTTLSSELSRVALASIVASSNQVTYTAIFPSGASTGGALQEAGIFNAGAAGTMLSRTIFDVVNKADGDSLTISWVITAN